MLPGSGRGDSELDLLLFQWQFVTLIGICVWHHRQKSVEILEVGASRTFAEIVHGLQCGELLCCRRDEELVH